MKRLFLAAVVCTFAAATGAQAATCSATASGKKLHGAALTSFMKKCEADAKKTCDTSANGKKLHGAARTSFVKKCVNDATGS